ncbi:PA2169 family four-helix-bundle protein [Epilithonimonas hungarica]|uniref:DUF2383 domain-containing protein n=1 Tax=Epilithonimonas hungarica TaxID=454006 RepID=A0A1G7UJ16_9FLAO|nr:PA2169 family four-helix-bundle protein [Epilithonimonas hungarica]SDG47241.1 conserved hypothetical protein [Epilithonimonas hungarica]
METQENINTLNDLLHVVYDRLKGFEQVEGKVWEVDADLKRSYEDITSQSKIMKNELIDLISEKGGKAQDNPSLSGTLHRTWIDIKNGFTVDSLQRLTLNDVLFGEKAAIQIYQEALDSGTLDQGSRSIVSEQLKKIKDSAHYFQGVLDNYKSN